MLFPSHLFLGLIILRIATELYPEHYSKNLFFTLFSIAIALLPDLDALGKTKLKDHHKSLFHAPFFWIVVFLVLLKINQPIAILFGAQILGHLFADYITARTAGVALFYPYSNKEYSLQKLTPRYGDFYVLDFKKMKKYFVFYSKNKLLSSVEISICILGIIAILL